MIHDGRDLVAGIVLWEAEVNKTQLIDALAERLGDKKIAAAAVAGLVDVVVRTVNGGDKVTITGFGVFEKRARAARMARNPRTGQSVKVKKTNVPVFRPGTLFREVVSGARKLPRASASINGASAARPAASAT
ncbi:MAG: HU family DNA-binding protein, partial [Actinomycetes bacterium]